MTNSHDQDRKPLRLSQPGRLELKKTVETGQVRQSFSHGRSKVVTVEVRKKRTFTAEGGTMHEVHDRGDEGQAGSAEALFRSTGDLTRDEKAARARALQDARRADEEARRIAALRAEEDRLREEEARRRAEEEARQAEEERRRREAEAEARAEVEAEAAPAEAAPAAAPAAAESVVAKEPEAAKPEAVVERPKPAAVRPTAEEEEEEERAKRPGRTPVHKPSAPPSSAPNRAGVPAS